MELERAVLERLEIKIRKLVEKMRDVINVNDILTKENIRLNKENRQLLEKVESIEAESITRIKPLETQRDKETTIDYIKTELNNCIEEIDVCLKDLELKDGK